MTVVGEAIVIVRPLTAGFTEKVVADADKAMIAAGRRSGESFGKSLASAIPGANGLQKGIVGITAAAAGAAIASIHMANDFNQNLLLLKTQAGASTAEVDRMRKATLDLAPSVAIGPAKLAEALYHIESTGIRGAAALDDLKIAAQGAKIGQADLDNTTYALTSTLMTGIHGITGAKDAMAQLDAIIGTGDMHMEDLNGAIGTGFLASAETFGVSLQSIGAALAYMTDRGSGAQESATRLRMSLSLMAAPSNQASKMLNAIGLGGAEVEARTSAMTAALQKAHLTTTVLADDMRKPDGIEVALTDLVTHLHESGLSADAASALISRAFGGGRSGAAIMSLVQHLDVLKGKYEEQVRIAGDYDERWKATTESTSFRWQQFTTLVQTDAIRIGESLIPLTDRIGTGLFKGLENAPAALRPIGEGLDDLGRSLGEVQHQLVPVEHAFVLALGGTVLVTVQTIGVVLRDVVAPSVGLVAGALHLLLDTTPGVILLSTVLAVRLLPVMAGLAATMGKWALEKVVVGFVNATEAAEGLSAKLAALNPWVIGLSIAIGAGIGFYKHYSDAKKEAREATDELTAAIGREQSGHQGELITSMVDQLNKMGVGDNIQRLGLNIRDVAHAAIVGGDAMDGLNTQLRAVMAGQHGQGLKQAVVDANGLEGAVHKLSGRLDEADNKYANMQHNAAVAAGALAKSKPPVDALAAAHRQLAAAETTLDKASGALDSSASKYADSLLKQFPIFDAYVDKLKLNGTQLLANIEGTTKAIVQEQDNVNTLLARGLDASVIKQLADKGPEYVAAAAQLSVAQLGRLQTDVSDYMTNIGTLSYNLARHDGTQTGQAFASALAGQQEATKRVAQLTFFKSVQSAVTWAAGVAGNGGSATGDQFADRVLAKKNTVLTAMLNALPAPVRAAALSALGIATDAGGRLPENLASAIAAHSPAAAAATEAMRAAVQARIDMLHGKTVEVRADDLASGALATINGNIQQLEGLNNTLKAMRYNADGNLYEAHDAQIAPGGAMRVWAEPETGGEAYIPLAPHKRGRSIDIWAQTGRKLGMFADGGIVDAGAGPADVWQVLLGRYAQSLASGTDPSKLFGGLGAGGIAGNVMSFLPIVLTALALNGAPASFAPRVLAQIQFESGGDPNIHQQVIDINTFNGSGGAQGLMQVLLDTFLRNHVPGTSMNIFDPLANVAAGIRHAINEDPGGLNYLGQGHGYDAGGSIRPGRTLVINNTGADEAWVLNGPQEAAARQRGRSLHIEQENHFYGVDLDEASTDAGARLSHAITTTLR